MAEKPAATWHPGAGPTPRTAADVPLGDRIARVATDALYAAEPGLRSDSGVEFMAASYRAEVVVNALATAGLLATAEPHPVVDPMLRPGQAVAFVRWLAEHDREVAAQALRDAAASFPASLPLGMTERDYLRGRAAGIAHGRIVAGEES
jgi:hypothetical protein